MSIRISWHALKKSEGREILQEFSKESINLKWRFQRGG